MEDAQSKDAQSVAPEGSIASVLDRHSNGMPLNLVINHLRSLSAQLPLDPTCKTPTPSAFSGEVAMEDTPAATQGASKRSRPGAPQAKELN